MMIVVRKKMRNGVICSAKNSAPIEAMTAIPTADQIA